LLCHSLDGMVLCLDMIGAAYGDPSRDCMFDIVLVFVVAI
jgi:hypothetical protein